MTNELLHQRTLVALARAACAPLVSDEDLDLLCWHAGCHREELNGVKVTGYRMSDMITFISPDRQERDLESMIAEEQ